jgi:uncharacterized glyoxalase superfamily protein PhnB
MADHIFPSLRYRDAAAAADWLEQAFGFERVAAHENEDGSLGHVEMRWGDSMIMFGQETDEAIERFGEHAGRGWCYVTVDDADAHHDRAAAAGAEIVYGLTDQDYGSRDYSARDPEGNLWSFGTYDPLAGAT